MIRRYGFIFLSFLGLFSLGDSCQPGPDGGILTIRRFCTKYSLDKFNFDLLRTKLNDPDSEMGFKKAVQLDLLRLMVLKGTNAQSWNSKVACFRNANPINPTLGNLQPVLFIRGNTTSDRLRQTLLEYSYMALPDETWYKILSNNIFVEEVQSDDANYCCSNVFPV